MNVRVGVCVAFILSLTYFVCMQEGGGAAGRISLNKWNNHLDIWMLFIFYF